MKALTLEEAIAVAISANRTLAAARLGREVSRRRVEVAKQRPNPDLALEAERETPREAATLSLPIETASKRRRRIDLAEAEAGSGEAEIARLTVETRNLVRRAYYALAAAQIRLTETEALLHIAERTRDATRERFETGAAARLELLQVELAMTQADNEAVGLRGRLLSAQSDLNTLLGWPAAERTVVAGGLEAGSVPDEESAALLATASSGSLALLDRRIAEGKARVALARAQRSPDPVLQAAATHRSPPEFDWGWRAGISLTLPMLATHRAELAVEESLLTQLEAERVAAAARIRGEVAASRAVASAQREQYLRYRDDILPRAAEVERMAEDSYRSGQTGLVAMLQSLEATSEARLRAVQAGYDYQVALADLERAIGAPLP